MKVELCCASGYFFLIEPETEIEKCALEYLGNRPKETIDIDVSYVGKFVPYNMDMAKRIRSEVIQEFKEKRKLEEENDSDN